MSSKGGENVDQYIIERNRKYAVCKANELIQSRRFSLSLVEQRIIWYLISKIKPEDIDLKSYKFKIDEFCRICGTEEDNNGNIEYIKAVIMKLYTRKFWMMISSTEEAGVGWIEDPIIDHENETIDLKINKHLKEYLIDLQGLYTTLDLTVGLVLTSKYSIRMYEILKSYAGLKKCEFHVDRLKKLVNGEKYNRFADFRRNILEPSVDEINQFADFKVAYTLEKTGKRYTKIYFTMKDKTPFQYHKTIDKIDEKLNAKQAQEQISMM